jgi:predicted peptidase
MLPYRLLIPKDYTPAKAWPLIVWLHGSGEKGTDNSAQLVNINGTFWMARIARPSCWRLSARRGIRGAPWA